jgi:acetyl-CoA acetyltransferase
MARPKLDWADVDDLVFGCANWASEDKRNVARMSRALFVMPKATIALLERVDFQHCRKA